MTPTPDRECPSRACPLERERLKLRVLIVCRELIANELVPSEKRLKVCFPDRSQSLLRDLLRELRTAGLIASPLHPGRMRGLGRQDDAEVQARIKAIRDQKRARGE